MKLKIICLASIFLALMTGCVYATSSKITESIANVHISDTSVQIIDQLKKGTAINVLDSNGRLLKISYGNNLEGWIDASCVKDKFPVTTALNWIEIPGAQELGTQVGGTLAGSGNNTALGSETYEKELEMLVALAKSKLGGGYDDSNWPHDFTCNGFVCYLYLHIYDEENQMAINLADNGIYQADRCKVRYDAAQIKAWLNAGIPLDDFLRPGDLVYTHGTGNWEAAGHVEMYIGEGKMIGSGGGNPSVKENDFIEALNSGFLHVVCRVIEGDEVYIEQPIGKKHRPLRKLPDELGIELYDYEAIAAEGVTVVDDNYSRNDPLVIK